MNLTSKLFPLAVFWHCKTFREHIWFFLQIPVFKFCPLAFSSVCPEGWIQCSKKAHPSAVHLSISEPWNCSVNLYYIKGILQSWKAAFLFLAACSGCVGLLVNLKGFFLIGQVGINAGLELLQEGSQELLGLLLCCVQWYWSVQSWGEKGVISRLTWYNFFIHSARGYGS